MYVYMYIKHTERDRERERLSNTPKIVDAGWYNGSIWKTHPRTNPLFSDASFLHDFSPSHCAGWQTQHFFISARRKGQEKQGRMPLTFKNIVLKMWISLALYVICITYL